MPITAWPPHRPRQSPPPTATPARSGLRVATPGHTRRPGLVALALVLILAGSTTAAVLYLRAGQRQQVLAVSRPVAAGHVITGDDLVSLSLSVDPRLHPIPEAKRETVIGQTATVNLVPGSLLLRRMLTSGTLLQAGEGLVGLALKPGQLPDQLAAGDDVQAPCARLPPRRVPASGSGAPESWRLGPRC